MDFEEICKQKILNSSLFRSNSSKLLDPNFDIKGFICEVLKVVNIPNINPVLNEPEPFYIPSQDFSTLLTVGDPRMPLGLVLSASYINFLPRNLVKLEAEKNGGTQIIEGVICNEDGVPVKQTTLDSFSDKENTEKEIFVRGILDDPDLKKTYSQYNFYQSICLEQPPVTVVNLEKTLAQIKSLPAVNIKPHTTAYNDLFSYSYGVDLCSKPLEFDKLLDIESTAEEYQKFTNNILDFGKTQNTLYFIEFLKRFLINDSWIISLNKFEMPPVFYISAKKVTDLATKTESTIYLKYWYDQIENVSTFLKINTLSSNISKTGMVMESQLARTIVDAIPDYRKIMKSSKLQETFYKYMLENYLYTPPAPTRR
jgi:hypothetical protein